MNSALRNLAWAAGVHPIPPNRGVLVIGGPSERLNALLSGLRAAVPRLNLYRIPKDEAALEVSPCIVVGRPFEFDALQRWYLRRLKIQAVIVCGAPWASTALFARARGVGIQLICVGPPDAAIADLTAAISLCAVSATERSTALASGVPERAIVVDGAVDEQLRRLVPLLVTARPPGKIAANFENRLTGGWRGRIVARIAQRKFRALESVASLKTQLNMPRSILCLGNGPSSEDPALSELRCDAVFRVNHSWLARSLFTQPDVVFTGKRDTLSAYKRPAVFGFQTKETATRIMLRSVLMRRRFTYFSAEQLGCMDFAHFHPYLPTNGVVMIATAVALAPEKIVVGGVDLFSDPRGSYPGDSGTLNAYTVAHERELEARFILQTLARFDGEVVIVGDVLKARWQRHLNESAANS